MGELAEWAKSKDKQAIQIAIETRDAVIANTEELKSINEYKRVQQLNDNKFRNSWRYGKLIAVFFMVIAFSLDVIQINSVEPAIDLIIKLFS